MGVPKQELGTEKNTGETPVLLALAPSPNPLRGK